jgi:hypothetical protein
MGLIGLIWAWQAAGLDLDLIGLVAVVGLDLDLIGLADVSGRRPIEIVRSIEISILSSKKTTPSDP